MATNPQLPQTPVPAPVPPAQNGQSGQQPETPASNTPATPAPAQNQPSPNPQSATPTGQQTQKPVQPNGSQPGTVSNTPAQQHPSIQRASLLHSVAEALAGGPRTVTRIDPQTGVATRTQVPLSKGDILSAIALEALSGSLAGLAQKGPNAEGQAAEAGYERVSQQQQQAQQQQEQQASQDFARQASAYELANRVRLNTAQAEKLGVENLKDAVAANADLLSAYEDQGVVDDQHISQDALLAGLKNGTYSALKQIAVPDGWTNVNGKYEQTFSIITNPSAKVPLTQAQAEAFGNAGVPGWLPYKDGKTKVPAGATVSGTVMARANAQLQSQRQMEQEFTGVTDALSNSDDKNTRELAAGIPSIDALLADPQNGPVLRSALAKFQKYVSHSDQHGMDLYQSLQQMAQPSVANPKNPKQFIPNPDAGFASIIAGAFGNGDPAQGWKVLRAYHDETAPEPITSEADAESILTDSASTPRERAHAKAFLTIAAKQKQAEARSRASESANGTLNVGNLTPKEYQSIIDGIGTNTLDASQMLRYGKADQLKILADVKAKYPNFDATQYQANLGLAKWATSGKGGDQIQALNTLHQHAADFLENINQLGNIDPTLLNTPINKLKTWAGDPDVPDTVARMLAVRTEYMNALNNNHALTTEDKADAQQLLNLNQSPAQWRGVLNQIQHTADLRGAETNARYRAVFNRDMPNYQAPAGTAPQKFQYLTSDGKMGWNGSAWVATGK